MVRSAGKHVTRRREKLFECQNITRRLRDLLPAKWSAETKKLLSNFGVSAVCVVLYVLIFSLIFGLNEEASDNCPWDAVTSVYYVMVTMSTVGYGECSPGSPGTRVAAIIMIFIGIGFIFPLLSSGVVGIDKYVTSRGRDAMERAFPQTHVDIDGSGTTDYMVPRHPFIYYSKNLLPSLLLMLLLQLIFAAIFSSIESNWHFGTSFYYCLVTATTVGYGDYFVLTTSGRVVAIFHILLSVVLLAEMFNTVDTLRQQRKAQLARIKQLERKLDPDLMSDLLKRGATPYSSHGLADSLVPRWPALMSLHGSMRRSLRSGAAAPGTRARRPRLDGARVRADDAHRARHCEMGNCETIHPSLPQAQHQGRRPPWPG